MVVVAVVRIIAATYCFILEPTECFLYIISLASFVKLKFNYPWFIDEETDVHGGCVPKVMQ